MNSTLAKNIVAEQPLIQNKKVNRKALDGLFHNLMVINPSIELYLLDPQGEVLAYSAPEGKVKRQRVEVQAIKSFIAGNTRYPLKGDDPRDFNGQKVFSAAKIANADGLQGYLYIALGGTQYDDVVQMLGTSFIMDSALAVLLVALAAALLSGLIIFAFQTRRLRLLSSVMRRYASENRNERTTMRYPENAKSTMKLISLDGNLTTWQKSLIPRLPT